MSEVAEKVVQGATLTGVLEEEKGLRWLRIIFVNRGSVPLWLPQEEKPAYRVDAEERTVTISYGYFDEIYGPYQGRYMLPPMEQILPQQEYSWKITDPTLVSKAFAPGMRTYIQARVALRSFKPSRVRGAQELEAYLKESYIVKSLELTARVR